MKIKVIDCKKLVEIVNKLIGLKAWGLKIGHGSFLTIEFGKPIIDRLGNDEYTHGEYHLWIYFSSWRFEKDDNFIAGCADSRDIMEVAVQRIEGSQLNLFEIISPAFDANLMFDNGMILKLFSVASENEENGQHWILYMPDNKVLLAGPGNKLLIEDKSE